MDDFEYSLHISDQDWDSFYQECEGCDLLSPGLASREDSGMSDIDEMGCHFLDTSQHPGTASQETDPDFLIDGPPDCEGSPVDSYLSKYGIRSPEQVLSGSEEDLHLQTVNLFFEQLKSVAEHEQPFKQNHVVNWGSEKTEDHLEGLIDKQVIESVVTCPSGRHEANLEGEITKQGEADTWGNKALEEAIMTTSTNAQVNALDSTERELVIEGGESSLQLITVGMKREQKKMCCDLSTKHKLKPETKPPDKEKMPHMVMANGRNMTDSSPAKENKAQLATESSTDSKDSLISQIPVSPSNLRRKRRKKKRMSNESGEPGHGYETQLRVLHSESEEERFIQKEGIYSFTTNVKKTEHPSLQRVKTSSIPHHSDNLLSSLSFTSEVSADLKCSKSLPVSLTTFGLDTQPEVRHTSVYNISKSMNDMSLVNNGQLKAEVCQFSNLPQTDKAVNLQEIDAGLNTTESDSVTQLRDTDCSPAQTGIGETLSEPLSDNSAAGCERKSLLSANISSAADSTETLSSSVSVNVTEGAYKDVSCLENEIDCCAFKSEQNVPSKWNDIRISDNQPSSLSLTENVDEINECCSDENIPAAFSQDTLQKGKTFKDIDISESQTFEISMNNSQSETNSEAECHVTESTVIFDCEKDDYIQSIDSSEVLSLNASPINPENTTDDLDSKGDISESEDGNSCHDVADKSDGEHLLCDKTTSLSENILGHKEEIMLGEDSVQNVLADASELLSSTASEMQGTLSCSSKTVAKDPESIVLDDQTPSPVYAISSFWDEMEKLTINDILRLRLIGNAQHPSVLTQPEDGSIADTTDAADSGYFTQPDDSKPGRLSGDMSFISDLDEDLEQLQTQCSLKQEDESCESFPSRSCSVTWENDSDPVITGDDMVFLSSESTLPEHLYTANAQECFRKMCKNISVQNLQALEAQPIRQILRNASLHSIHSEADDPFYHINTSYPTCMSDDEEMESSGVTFSEIIQYFFGDEEPERCASRADSNAASCLDETGTSVPEMYDHFFSEFESGSSFYQFEDESSGNKDKMIPIFSCTRSANRNLHFPEAYDYFFPDSPGHSDEDDENDNTPIKVLTRYDHKSSNRSPVSATDMYEHFYPEDTFEGNFLWTNPFSLRKVRRAGPAVSEEESCSWAVTPVKPFHKGIESVTVVGPDDKPFPDTLYISLEKHIFQQLAEQQKKCMEMQTVVADPRLDAPFLPLRQADMCLVCIAFASWVLKSASPGADAWKAALLANVSALSAIRYLRRHKREEVSGKTSLRQIEPA